MCSNDNTFKIVDNTEIKDGNNTEYYRTIDSECTKLGKPYFTSEANTYWYCIW